MSNSRGSDVTRRTHLAAERTWLAWWRTGIATSATAIAVGGVLPELLDGSRVPYVVLGGCYALLAVAIFLLAGQRQREVDRALEEGNYVGLGPAWVAAFTLVGSLLALGTFIAIVVQA